MKVVNFTFLTFSLFFSMSNAFAQVEVFSNGNVRVGTAGTCTLCNASDLNIDRDIYIQSHPASSGIHIGNNGGNPALIPQWTNTASIGSSSLAMWSVYSYNLYSNGGTVQTLSDKRVKKNIKKLESGLEKVLQLNPIHFDYIEPPMAPGLSEKRKQQIREAGLNKIGFIAQEVNKVFPEVVGIEEESGLYTVDYASLIPALVHAIQEQQEMINELRDELENKNNLLPESKGLEMESRIVPDERKMGYIMQNRPNPFNTETQIKYNIESNVKDAKLYVYDLTGRQVKSYEIQDRGQGALTVKAYELEAGTYIYSLIVDNREIDSKKMILTK